MILRRLTLLIVFFIPFILSTGLYFFVGKQIVERISGSKSIEQVLLSNNAIVLPVPISDYQKLVKEQIAKDVFEISYKGVQYDVYARYTKNGIVYLTAVADNKEMSLLGSLKNICNESTPRTSSDCQLTFFSFYFFESFDKISFTINCPQRVIFDVESASPNRGFTRKNFSPPRS